MAETNHNNKKNVSLGKPKKTGCLYYAPAGTALPADATTALPAAYTCVGYLSEDGVTNATDSAGDAIGYGVTMSANPSDLINGSTSVEYIAKVTTATIAEK